MLLLKTVAELKNHLATIPANATIGFVPTMGALHDGHISLIDIANNNADYIVVSIFVNPIQFNNAADFEKYPSTLNSDIALIGSKAHLVFAPSIEEIYGGLAPKTSIHFGEIESVLEGEMRPGHFSGVGIILSRLFNYIKPHKLFMGAKDFQQCAVVKQLINDLGFDIALTICPTKREANGLAMSSRNERLSEPTRAQAGIIYKVLNEIIEHIPNTPFEQLKLKALEVLSVLPNFQLEYLSIHSANNLMEKQWPFEQKEPLVIFIACWVEGVRLIDNIEFSL